MLASGFRFSFFLSQATNWATTKKKKKKKTRNRIEKKFATDRRLLFLGDLLLGLFGRLGRHYKAIEDDE
jgi:hypothetical protein